MDDPQPQRKRNHDDISNDNVRVCLIDSIGQLSAAMALLKRCSSVAVDIEGENLGKNGRIATIQIAPDAPTAAPGLDDVYVIDVATLGPAAFSAAVGLRELLEGSRVTKLFFDVRTDSNALFYLHGLKLATGATIDLQLANVALSVLKKIPLNHHVGLAKLLSKAPDSVLTATEREHTASVIATARKMFSSDLGGSYSVWLKRPLSPALLEYATDVRFFHRLLDHLLDEDWLPLLRPALIEATTRRIEYGASPRFVPHIKDHAFVREPEFVRNVQRLSQGASYSTAREPNSVRDNYASKRMARSSDEDVAADFEDEDQTDDLVWSIMPAGYMSAGIRDVLSVALSGVCGDQD